MIKCKTCSREHEDPFFFCPNCGTPLITVMVGRYLDSLEFTAAGWRREIILETKGARVEKIISPRLQFGSLVFQDQDLKTVTIPVLVLYKHLRDGIEVLAL